MSWFSFTKWEILMNGTSLKSIEKLECALNRPNSNKSNFPTQLQQVHKWVKTNHVERHLLCPFELQTGQLTLPNRFSRISPFLIVRNLRGWKIKVQLCTKITFSPLKMISVNSYTTGKFPLTEIPPQSNFKFYLQKMQHGIILRIKTFSARKEFQKQEMLTHDVSTLFFHLLTKHIL